jgi:hypothetical protein
MLQQLKRALILGVILSPVLIGMACSSIRSNHTQAVVAEDGSVCEPPSEIHQAPRHIHSEPLSSHDNKMMSLASDLDHLEKHIDWYGSVTAKVPDIWGQQRLTKYREEIENEFAKDLTSFTPYLQGSLSRSDQAFFANATTLSLIAAKKSGGDVTPPAQETVIQYEKPPLVNQGKTITQTTYDDSGKKIREVVTTQAPATRVPPPATPPAEPDPTAPAADNAVTLVPDTATEITRTPIVGPSRIGGFALNGKDASSAIGLEPVQLLQQKKRYLEFLSQLRRTNEGDDTADAPGYSLNLMRVPVSILPGKRTDVGHGAEVTFTVSPVLSDEFLPATFRNLIINDLTKQNAFALTKFLDDAKKREQLDSTARLASRNIEILKLIMEAAENKDLKIVESCSERLPEALRVAILPSPAARERIKKEAIILANKQIAEEWYMDLARSAKVALPSEFNWDMNNLKLNDSYKKDLLNNSFSKIENTKKKKEIIEMKNAYIEFDKAIKDMPDSLPEIANSKLKDDRNKLINDYSAKFIADGVSIAIKSKVDSIFNQLTVGQVPFSTGSRSRQSIPNTQVCEVYGEAFTFEVAYRAKQALEKSITDQGYAHFPDVQSFLKVETDAAYRLLKNKSAEHLWKQFCTPDLVRLVHTRNYAGLRAKREEYIQAIKGLSGEFETNGRFKDKSNSPDEQPEFSSTVALAWGLLVQAALLNDRLMLDIKETAATKSMSLPLTSDWPEYFLPEPSPTERRTFNDYVKARWPVHVFALDPTTDDQNIADTLSVRREMQFALSVAFAGGRINTNQFNRFSRRLEAEYETIDLNRTQIGFSHGNDVFGWRFYPRFQTPPTRSNAVTILRDQLIGGPNKSQMLRERRLEAGPRECVALVIMPSFVPNVTLEVTTNWFGLANPKHKVFDHTQALKLSRTVQSIRTANECIVDANKYRAGDLNLLLNRAEQLSERLPMQALASQVPVDSNLGGFDLFVNGTSALAPELFGWYGAPGISPKKHTTLFIVGNHFSVTQTRVLAGNKEVTEKKMISRQVMQITLTKIPLVVKTKDGDRVQINVSTPYGVSQELLVPVIDVASASVGTAEPTPAVSLPNVGSVTYAKNAAPNQPAGTYTINYVSGPDQPMWIEAPKDLSGNIPLTAELEFSYKNCPINTIVVNVRAQGMYCMIDAEEAAKASKQLVNSIAKMSQFTDETNPFTQRILTTKIVIKQDKKQYEAKKPIGFDFECSIPLEKTK